MTKYSISIKKQIVELVREKGCSIYEASKIMGVSKSLASRWLRMYEHHGYEGLILKHGAYSGKFKIDAVEYMHNNKLSIKEASARLGIPSHSTLLKWERIYYNQGEDGLLKVNRGRPRKNMTKKTEEVKLPKKTEEDLIEEVQRLRAEVAYLKKYNALVQKEERLEQARKRK